MITLLLFLHHLAKSIVSDSIIERVGAQLDAEIERQCPETPNDASDAFETPADPYLIRLPASGYVQAIEYEDILAAACEFSAVVEIRVRAGHHVVDGVIAAAVAPAQSATAGLEQTVLESIAVASARTIVQDLEFPTRHLVEVAVRALSPGINDVYTALAAIDRLSTSLRKMMRRAPPQSAWRDRDGRIRVVAPTLTFAGLVDASFNQIRQSAAGKPAILIRMVDAMG